MSNDNEFDYGLMNLLTMEDGCDEDGNKLPECGEGDTDEDVDGNRYETRYLPPDHDPCGAGGVRRRRVA